MKKNIVKKKSLFLTFIAITGLSVITIAQNFQWAKSMGGAAEDRGNSITIDASGNVYTVGVFTGGVDFDPGLGVYNLSSAGERDVFISKLDPAGNFVWAKNMGGTNYDIGLSIALDTSGNVYTTGVFSGTADFDPGTAIFNLTSGVGSGFISKLDSSGNFVWAKSIDGASCTSIIVDYFGNVYTTGYFNTGTVDFDPGVGVYNLTSSGVEDVFISKLDSSGNFVWAKSMGGSSTDIGSSIAVDTSGNIYVTGFFQGTADFNPGVATYNLTSAGAYDIYISKLDFSGNFVWAKSIGGTVWDQGKSIAVDVFGNVYTTGYFNTGTVDFDPGVGVYNLTSSGVEDVFISKLDSSGNFVWAKSMGGSSTDIGSSIAVDTSGNIYVTGFFQGTADFNPGVATYNLTSAGASDIFTSKLDSSGNFLWAKSMGGYSSDLGNSIAVDSYENVHTTGVFQGTADFDPSVGTYNLLSSGGLDIFISKLCAPSPSIGSIAGSASVCLGAAATYSVASVSGVAGYLWTVPSGTIINSGQNTTSVNVTFGAISGNITVTPSNLCSVGSPQNISVTIISLNQPISGTGTTLYCAGNATIIASPASGGTTIHWYSASSGGTLLGTGLSYSATFVSNTTIYASTYNSSIGCESVSRIPVTVTFANLNQPISGSGASICSSGSATISAVPATGGTHIRWYSSSSGGTLLGTSLSYSTTFTVTTTLYAASYNATTGCESSARLPVLVTVANLNQPTIGIVDTICGSGQASTSAIPASGGTTINWYNTSTGGTPVFVGLSYSALYLSTAIIYASTYNLSTGCESTIRVPITIVVNPLPIIAASVTNANYGDNGTANIMVDQGQAPYIYDWNVDGTGDFDDSQNQTGLLGGDYLVTVSDQNECKDTIGITIENGGELFVTTGISPNGDGLNDVWAILGITQFEDVQVNVFNLIGQCVYHQQGKYIPWDGLYNGMLTPVGDYYYVIESIIKKKKLTGALTVKY